MRKRHKHNLSHYHLTTFDLGQLIPVACVDVLPGDTFDWQSSLLLRMSTLVKPVMHPVDVRIHHFYVPYRILWDGWEDFITGVSATPPPQIIGASHGTDPLIEYLGIYNDASNSYNAFNIRAYNMIYNQFYRDADIDSEVTENSVAVQNIRWEKDYLTTARTSPQKGTAVTIPLGGDIPVLWGPNISGTDYTGNSVTFQGTGNPDAIAGYDTDKPADSHTTVNTGATHGLKVNMTDATAPDVIEFREAMAMQRYQEARARYGSSHTDYLRYLGVKPSDGRLDRPEYLGGGKQTIAFSEVLNQSDAGAGDVGDLYGHGITALRSNRFRKFFEEHGVVMTMASIRPKTIWCSGQPKKYAKQNKEDYFQPEFEHVGMQEILNKEVYAAHATPDGVFGYGQRYREYREEMSYVSGDFLDAVSDDWHLGQIFTSTPALNSTFLQCNPSQRIFADGGTNANVHVMINHRIAARRIVKRNAAPMLL